MRIRNDGEHYGLVTKLTHWLLAVTIIGLGALGWWMVDLTYYDRWYNDSLTWHKQVGIVALAVALVQLGWLALSPLPALAVQGFSRHSAKVAHRLLLLLTVLVPLSGYLISTSAGKGIDLFGLATLPAVINVDDSWREVAISTHFYSSYGLLALAALHALAAIKHTVIDRDGTLRRIL